MSPDTEEKKIEAAQRDPAHFAALYEDNFYRIYAYIARRTGDRSQAEDLTSEVFREALANIAKFEWRGVPFASWLLRIASNSLSDHWRRVARERPDGAVAEEKPSPAEIEQSALLFQLVDRLPGAQRRVIEMRFVEQKSIREIAQEMDRSEGAVKQLQLRAIENLRNSMEGGK
jgi:RNA polymerase sigma-70 factor (ECF subfamily)